MSLEQMAQAELVASDTASRCTDLANAHRLVEHYGDRLLYVEGIGWHVFGPPWCHDELAAREIAHTLGRIIADEADALTDWVAASPDSAEMKKREEVVKSRRAWGKASESSGKITAALQEAAPLLRCKAEVLDADKDLLGVQNGVIDLRTFEFREFRPQDRITKTCGVAYDPDARWDVWQEFVDGCMGGDHELSDFLYCLSGYLLSGHRGEHVLPVLHGNGANGKSTFLGALQHVMGDYAGTAPPGLLIQRSGTEHPTGLASLQGRRLVVSSETGEGGSLAEAQVKQLTGGDRIAARRMHQDFYEFDPTHLIVLATNHKPRVTGTDEGIWRRLKLVPFAVTVPEDKRDPMLPQKLAAEGCGILNWLLCGLRKYKAKGLPLPEAIRTATDEYRSASDVVGSFLEECTASAPGEVRSGELYQAYSTWCGDSGERAMAQKQFGIRLEERGLQRHKGAGGNRFWLGLRILDSDRREYSRASRG